jgi:hypothetical protein
MGKEKTIFEKGASAGDMRAKNPDEFGTNFGGPVRYRVEGQVYIFSCARRTFSVNQTLFPSTELLGCLNGERYVLATTVADPLPQASPDLERGGKRIDYEDGWRGAIGLLHPEHPLGGNGDWFTGADQPTMSEGVNLIAQGLWPSRTNPPDEQDIRRAEAFRDKRYRRLTDQAFQKAARGSKHLADFLREHEDVADAMDALGLSADWHRRNQKVLASCPNCGDQVAGGLAFHRSSVTDRLCVIDPARAFAAKAITREEMEELMTAPAV